MIEVGKTVRVTVVMPHNWPDPSMRQAESMIVGFYVGEEGKVVRIEQDMPQEKDDRIRLHVPVVVKFDSPRLGEMPREMRFREFELAEVE